MKITGGGQRRCGFAAVGSASVVRGEHVWQSAGSRQVQLLSAIGGGKKGPIIFDGIVADVISVVVIAVVVTFFVDGRDVLWPSLPFCTSLPSSFINIIQRIVTFAGAIISRIVIAVITPIATDASISSIVVDGDRDIRRRCSASIIIIYIIPFHKLFVFLSG